LLNNVAKVNNHNYYGEFAMKTTLFKTLCMSVCVTGIMLAASVAQAKNFTVGHIQNTDHAIHKAMEKFKQYVEKASNGGITVQIFPNSQLGDALTQISSMRMGTLGGFVDGVGWYGQLEGDYYLPATAYAIKNWDAYNEVMGGEVGKEMSDKLLKNFGLRVLDQAWARLPRNVLARMPIRNIGDLQGKKMRVPELKSYIIPWQMMGSTPTPVAFSEVYLALQQGVVDALECPIDNMYTSRLQEVAKYLVMTRHQMESANFVVSEQVFSTLTDDEKKIILDGAAEAKAENDRVIREAEANVIEKMKADGVEVIEVNVQEFYDRAKEAPVVLENDGTWTKGLAAKVEAINAKH
jgi:tripartite ATP-independent transporter DctP family solute receptor